MLAHELKAMNRRTVEVTFTSLHHGKIGDPVDTFSCGLVCSLKSSFDAELVLW